jgi:hypothetical protein
MCFDNCFDRNKIGMDMYSGMVHAKQKETDNLTI